MALFLIRRLIQMCFVAFLVSFVSFALLSISPGGPIQELLEEQSASLRLNTDAVQLVMKRYDLDIDILPRFTRWLIGQPRGPLVIGGQEYFGATKIGCLEEGQVEMKYPDGHVELSNCKTPVYLNDLKGRAASNGILALDFGLSQQILRDRPVSDLIGSRIGNTLLLMGLSTFLAILIGAPIGILSAVKQYSPFDYFMTTLSFFTSGMPTLFLGLMGVIFFSLTLQNAGLPYLPPNQAEAARDTVVPLFGNIVAGSLADRLWHLTMPVAVLTLVNLAGWSRFVRSSMLEALRQDYVRTARSKGLNERMVILKHALRNSLIPFVTLIANVLPSLFTGAIITETIFSWPGMGKLFIGALQASDYPVAMAFVMISTFLTLIGFLLTDVLYTIVDPRIRLS